MVRAFRECGATLGYYRLYKFSFFVVSIAWKVITMSGICSSKELVKKYFAEGDNDVWTCKCKKSRKKGKGWANLIEHIQREHADTLEAAKKKGSGPILQFFSKKDTNLFSWVEWIVKDLLPFRFCKKSTTKKFSRLEAILVESLMKAMTRLTVKVEQKLKSLLPDMFSLAFDGWSSGGTHFLTVFAMWPDSDQTIGYSQAMLSFAPLQDEEHLDADSHMNTILEILRFYGKDYSNIACITGDNCSTNRSLAQKAHLYFVGCASHRLNLGVKIILESYSPVTESIHAVMTWMRNLKARAALRRYTHLGPVLCNMTRWSSMKKMIDRYFEILEPISIVVPAELQLSPGDNRMGGILQKILVDLDMITVQFQHEDLSMCDVRANLDVAIQAFPKLSEHCGPESRIVADPEFENAVVKIQMAQQCNEQLALNRAQELCVQHLKKPLDNPGVEEIQPQPQPTDLQALMKKIKKRKMEASSSSGCSSSTSSYIDVRFIRPTSNKCERQFSVAGFAFTKNRQGLLPINLEMQLFLNANQHLWDLELFHSNDNE